MNRHYPFVAERAEHRCEYCRAPEQVFNFHFEIEYIVPLSLGGRDVHENLALACTACNLFKSDEIEAFDEITNRFVRLFDPRRDDWREHFQVETKTALVLGQTAIGRAPAKALRINSRSQVLARLEWMLIGKFP